MSAKTGWAEIQHTADRALKVWAPDFQQLLQAAALGMYQLMEVDLSGGSLDVRELSINAPDDESLLVNFLNELLFLLESERVGFYRFEFSIHNRELCATIHGSRVIRQAREIKAVTFHNLKLRRTEDGLSTVVIFDV